MEIWKDIEGYEGKYQISSLGIVKNILTNKIISPRNYGRNYQHVWLCKNGIKKSPAIHRLVAQAFIPNPENKPQVGHGDNNPSNNSLENLEWCTGKENMLHCKKEGRIRSGENHHKAKLTWEKVKQIREKSSKGATLLQLKTEYGVNEGTIWFIIKNKTWIS